MIFDDQLWRGFTAPRAYGRRSGGPCDRGVTEFGIKVWVIFDDQLWRGFTAPRAHGRAGGPLLERCWPVGPNTEAREVLARFNTSSHRCWPTVLAASGVGTQYCPLVSRHEEAASVRGSLAQSPSARCARPRQHHPDAASYGRAGSERVCICCNETIPGGFHCCKTCKADLHSAVMCATSSGCLWTTSTSAARRASRGTTAAMRLPKTKRCRCAGAPTRKR